MSSRGLLFLVVVAVLGPDARGDEALYRYEGEVLPYDESVGWAVFNPCEPPCSESLEDGHFVLRWSVPNDIVNYSYLIAEPPDAPPPRSGSSGASAPTIRSGRTSTRATHTSRSVMAGWTSTYACTVTRRFRMAAALSLGA